MIAHLALIAALVALAAMSAAAAVREHERECQRIRLAHWRWPNSAMLARDRLTCGVRSWPC